MGGVPLRRIGTIMTIASIVKPRWVSFSPVSVFLPTHSRLCSDGFLLSTHCATNTSDQNDQRENSMGLHKWCSAVEGYCRPFPRASDCLASTGNFCHLWRTVGFLISFTVVVEFATLVSFSIIIAGGVQRRTAGWKVASSLLVLCAIIQCAGMAIVVRLLREDSGSPMGHW